MARQNGLTVGQLSGQAPREDPRVARTRALIEQSFYELLMEKKLHTLTIGEIASRAQINRATFYAHFADKYDLYRHLVQRTFEDCLERSLDGARDDTEARLHALVRAVCTFFQELNSTCPPADRRTRPLVEVEVQRQVYDSVFGWLQEDTTRNGLAATPETTARMISWAIWGAGMDWEGEQRSVDGLAQQIYAVVARMV